MVVKLLIILNNHSYLLFDYKIIYIHIYVFFIILIFYLIKMILDPVISVLMPVYNGEKFLKESIDSILNQTYDNFEFIIINDGSTDATEEIVFSYSDNRIIYIKNEINLKLIKTLNKGIDLAKGRYIARMDADDISHPDRFKIQLEQIEKYHCQVVTSSYTSIDENSKNYGFHLGCKADEKDLKFMNMFLCTIAHPSVLAETNVLKKYYYKDEKEFLHVEDYELWSRMSKDNVKFFISNISLLKYRRTDSNVTVIHIDTSLKKHIKIANQNQKEFVGESLSDEAIYFLINPKFVKIENNLESIYDEIVRIKSRFKDIYGISFATSNWFYYKIFASFVKCKVSLVKKFFFIVKHPIILFKSTAYFFTNIFSI